ncbi:MAG: DUF5989 family protein [Chthoniobacteraceae bacterium]
MQKDPGAFEKAARSRPPGLWRELWSLLRENKKWWLLPIIIALLAVGMLIALAAAVPAAAPFIYSFF